jgi:hypothetical protein
MKYILIILVLFFCSCKDQNNDCTDTDYAGCNTTEPTDGELKVLLTINAENPAVPIYIYKGKIEEGALQVMDTAESSVYRIKLPVNEYYSVAAKYKSGSKTIYAVDGDRIKKKSSAMCDSTCWSVVDAKVNVKLK